MKKLITDIIITIAFLAVFPAHTETIFKDTFDISGTFQLFDDPNTKLEQRQADGLISSTYSLQLLADSRLKMGTSVGDRSGEAELRAVFDGTEADAAVILDLDSDLGPNLTGDIWSLTYKARLARTTSSYSGWVGFSVGNPANTPNGSDSGFGLLLMVGGYYEVYSLGAKIGSGTLGISLSGANHIITAEFDETAGTVSLNMYIESNGTNIDMGTHAISFADSSRHVEFRNYVGSSTVSGQALFYLRDLQIDLTEEAPHAEFFIAENLLTNGLALTWTTDSRYTYALEQKISLLDSAWTTNTADIAGTGENVTITTSVDQASSTYRITGSKNN